MEENKIFIFWIHFNGSSGSNSYYSSEMTLDFGEFNKDIKSIGKPRKICNCGELSSVSINLSNKKTFNMKIKDIKNIIFKYPEGKEYFNDHLKDYIDYDNYVIDFYKVLKNAFKNNYNTFEFNGKNIAILTNEIEIDIEKIVNEFIDKLKLEGYIFDIQYKTIEDRSSEISFKYENTKQLEDFELFMNCEI